MSATAKNRFTGFATATVRGAMLACRGMLGILAMMIVLGFATRSPATVVFNQPPNPAGGHFTSAWYAPDGLDSDEYTWDDFTLASSAAITELRWRGCYVHYLSGAGLSPVYQFSISIYRSIPGGSQPDLGPGGRLVRYFTSGNAGESPAGSAGGVNMYDYSFALPAPFQAAAGTKYWVQIEASQGLTPVYYWPPDWSLAAGTGGNNLHFRRITGGTYQFITGDLAFSLLTSGAPTVNIATSVSPAGSGTVPGAGAYPVNSTVVLDATANPGWGFVNFTENGSPVSSNAHYVFTATSNRSLVANFVPAYTVTTASYPEYGGSTAGGGTYNSGAMVTLTATPNHGFVFAGWSDGSPDATHTFTANADVILTAFFDSAPLSATFDFDNAPVHTSLPIDLAVNGLSAHFAGTDGNFSVQPTGTVGISPPGFSGLNLFPNTVFAADLIVDFSETLVDFSILYSPQELGCDNSATMRATAYLNGVFVGTNTTTAPMPGTWPSATLSIAVPTGFNRVVVHYDHRPPTCQDYGMIFLADNVTVTRQCVEPSITVQPSDVSACVGGNALLSVHTTGSAAGHQWQIETPVGSGLYTDLIDGPVVGVGLITGAAAADVSITGLENVPLNRFRCVIVNLCGSITSNAATVMVGGPSCCRADFNHDGTLDPDDLADYIGAFFAQPPGAGSDFNADGITDPDDLADFIGAFFAGC